MPRRSNSSRNTKPTRKALSIQNLFTLFILLLIYLIVSNIDMLLPEDAAGNLDGNWVRLDVLDVGQGDCLLLTSSLGEAMLIDAGSRSQESTVLEFLQQRQINKLDYVIATHPHEDHIGSLTAVINTIPIDTFYMPNAINDTAIYRTMLTALENKDIDVVAAEAGMKLPWKSGNATILSPRKGETYDDLNNYSVVLHLQFGETSFLLTGDAEAIVEEQILSGNNNIRADVLKIGHHGSSSSTTPAFLQEVDPLIALISCGTGNSYGHPHRETMEKLQKLEVAVYRTDQQGYISVTSDGEKLYIETEK